MINIRRNGKKLMITIILLISFYALSRLSLIHRIKKTFNYILQLITSLSKRVKSAIKSIFSNRLPAKKRKIIVGETAVGKTRLLNYFFNKSYPIGMGDCTTKITLI